ncbi:MAG: hypothetical protein IT168_31765 [Bryobacterales bacterium]|nr:hypothetical protein [Bryobacterales bacterium]
MRELGGAAEKNGEPTSAAKKGRGPCATILWHWDPESDAFETIGSLEEIAGVKSCKRFRDLQAVLAGEQWRQLERCLQGCAAEGEPFAITLNAGGRAATMQGSKLTEGGSVRVGGTIAMTHVAPADQEISRLTALVAAKEEELRKSNEDLQQFAYAVSHDLQEPLRTISAFTQLLEQSADASLGEEPRMFMRHVVDSASRLYALMADLREYMEVGDAPNAERTAVSMEQVYRMVLRNLAMAIEESGAVITADPLPTVRGHRVHFVQLLQNLISNAIKYRGDATPRIHISVERVNGEWRLGVADNGIGIDREHHRRIFGLFKRLHGRRFQGTGIGLSICEKVVERYGGRIWVESEEGSGATFYFTLPVGEGKR